PGRSRVDIITKPAANRLRGEMNFYFADESLNARNPFAGFRAPYQSRHFSTVLSGPFIRDRWGFVAEYSRNGLDDNAVINALVLDPVTLVPERFNTTVLAPTKGSNFSFRTTSLFAGKHTFDARYLYSDESAGNQGLYGGFDLPDRATDRKWRGDTVRLSLISGLNEKTLNEARFSFTRGHSLIEARDQSPAVIVFDSFSSGGNQESLFLDEVTRTLRFENNFTHIAGRHSLKFGVSAGRTFIENTDRSNFGGTFIFGSDFERGPTGFPLPNGSYIWSLDSYRNTVQRLPGYRPLQYSINQGDPYAEIGQTEVGVFAQDNWLVSRRITLSLGLRAESQTNLDSGLNLAPRAAIAIRPFKDDRGTFRVGAGLFYTRVSPYVTMDAIRFDGIRQEELLVVRPPFFPSNPPLDRATAQTTLRPKSANLEAPRTFVTSASYEHKLLQNLSATVAYTFERGLHLMRIRNINAPIPGTSGQRPDPTLGPVLQYESEGTSRRHELAASVYGQMSDRFSFFGSYRLASAKSDTDGTKLGPADSYNTAPELGYTILDRRHQFYFEAYAQLPGKISFSPNVYIASGAPFNITTGNDGNGDTLFTDRPAFAQAGTVGAVTTAFGTFRLQPQAGDAIIPRNYGRGEEMVSLNLNLSRTFAFGPENVGRNDCRSGRLRCGIVNRRYALTFGMDVYNVLNRTNFSEFIGVLTSPQFGTPNRASDPRRLNLGVSLSF
nr:TonB-dependent receptor [Blastocatellia bacterium]